MAGVGNGGDAGGVEGDGARNARSVEGGGAEEEEGDGARGVDGEVDGAGDVEGEVDGAAEEEDGVTVEEADGVSTGGDLALIAEDGAQEAEEWALE